LLDVADLSLGIAQAFKSQDGFSLSPNRHIDAAVERLAVNQDCASTALAYITAVLDAVQAGFPSEHIG
jgi:hypothetical protein